MTQLLRLACRNGLDSRAVSICEAMPTADVVSLAAKYAAKLGKHQLAEKISDVANRMSFSSVEENGPEDNSEADQPEEASQEQVQTAVNYSQDMFEENNSAKENLILNMKKKKQQMSPKPLRLRKPGNPFKKTRDNPTSSNGDENSECKPKFMDWYDSNRSRLQEEFPLLKESELIIASMKRFRQEISSKSCSPNDSLKLSLNETLNSSCSESLDESTNGNISVETKKRKMDIEDNVPKKKISTSSKLKSFSFSKR